MRGLVGWGTSSIRRVLTLFCAADMSVEVDLCYALLSNGPRLEVGFRRFTIGNAVEEASSRYSHGTMEQLILGCS